MYRRCSRLANSLRGTSGVTGGGETLAVQDKIPSYPFTPNADHRMPDWGRIYTSPPRPPLSQRLRPHASQVLYHPRLIRNVVPRANAALSVSATTLSPDVCSGWLVSPKEWL